MFKQQFLLCPTDASYTHADSASRFKRTQLDGGKGRYRADLNMASQLVEARWVLLPDDYKYAQAFYAHFQARPEAFVIDLVVDDADLRGCDAWFIPDTFRLVSKQGDVFTITATLEIVPPKRDSAVEDWWLSLLSYFGPSWPVWADKLDEIVNVDMPAAIPYPPVPFPEVAP